MNETEAADIADTIDGWMLHSDLKYLFTQASLIPKGGKIIELGCWLGRSMSAMALGHPFSEDLYAVDTFEGTKNEDEVYFKTDRPPLELFKENLLRCVGFLPQIIVGDSADSSSLFEDNSIDFIFIDADHSYEGVRRDILSWMPKMKLGSYMMGHDSCHKPIQDALHDIFKRGLTLNSAIWNVKIE